MNIAFVSKLANNAPAIAAKHGAEVDMFPYMTNVQLLTADHHHTDRKGDCYLGKPHSAHGINHGSDFHGTTVPNRYPAAAQSVGNFLLSDTSGRSCEKVMFTKSHSFFNRSASPCPATPRYNNTSMEEKTRANLKLQLQTAVPNCCGMVSSTPTQIVGTSVVCTTPVGSMPQTKTKVGSLFTRKQQTTKKRRSKFIHKNTYSSRYSSSNNSGNSSNSSDFNEYDSTSLQCSRQRIQRTTTRSIRRMNQPTNEDNNIKILHFLAKEQQRRLSRKIVVPLLLEFLPSIPFQNPIKKDYESKPQYLPQSLSPPPTTTTPTTPLLSQHEKTSIDNSATETVLKSMMTLNLDDSTRFSASSSTKDNNSEEENHGYNIYEKYIMGPCRNYTSFFTDELSSSTYIHDGDDDTMTDFSNTCPSLYEYDDGDNNMDDDIIVATLTSTTTNDEKDISYTRSSEEAKT